MQWAALVTWLLTAIGGLVLLFQWLRHGGLQQRKGSARHGCFPTCCSR